MIVSGCRIQDPFPESAREEWRMEAFSTDAKSLTAGVWHSALLAALTNSLIFLHLVSSSIMIRISNSEWSEDQVRLDRCLASRSPGYKLAFSVVLRVVYVVGIGPF